MHQKLYIYSLLFFSFLVSCSKNDATNPEGNDNLEGRNPYIVWENTIGGFNWDILSSIEQTSDGGYIVGGTSNSEVTGDKAESSWVSWAQDYWVVKLNSNGEIEWQNSIGSENEEDMRGGIHQTKDGGYIIGGSSSGDNTGDKNERNKGSLVTTYDFWIVKLDSGGNIQWQNTIGGSKNDVAKSIIQIADGGYLVGGISSSNKSFDKTEDTFGNDDYWVVKLDANGSVQWEKTYGGSGVEKLEQVIETEGGYILGGSSTSVVSGNKTVPSNGLLDYWIVKIDLNGNILWQISVGGNGDDFFGSLVPTEDGGYLLSGASWDEESIILKKIDHNGALLWQKSINEFSQGFPSRVRKVVRSQSNIYYIGGSNLDRNGFYQFYDSFVLKIDESGNVLNQIVFETPGYDELEDLALTSDGSLIVGSQSWSKKSKDKSEDYLGFNDYQISDYWVIKISPNF